MEQTVGVQSEFTKHILVPAFPHPVIVDKHSLE